MKFINKLFCDDVGVIVIEYGFIVVLIVVVVIVVMQGLGSQFKDMFNIMLSVMKIISV